MVQFPRQVSSHASPSLVIPSSVMFTCIPGKSNLSIRNTPKLTRPFSPKKSSLVFKLTLTIPSYAKVLNAHCSLPPLKTKHVSPGLPVDPTGRNLSLSVYGTFHQAEFSKCKDEDKVTNQRLCLLVPEIVLISDGS